MGGYAQAILGTAVVEDRFPSSPEQIRNGVANHGFRRGMRRLAPGPVVLGIVSSLVRSIGSHFSPTLELLEVAAVVAEQRQPESIRHLFLDYVIPHYYSAQVRS